MKWFWLLLLKYLMPGVDDPEAGESVPEGDEPDDADDADPEGDEDAGDGDDGGEQEDEQQAAPPPRESRAQRMIRETRERAQNAERAAEAARAEIAAMRAREAAGPAQPTQDQLVWQQEEEALRNPETSDWQRYAINANRAARAAASTSQAALQRAEDLSDRTAFAAVATTNPKLYAAYKDRVEDKLKELRARGQNPPREGILKLLVGEDMISGKLKPQDAKPRNGAAPRATPRSDVSTAGGVRMSDAEKRAKRLENIRI